MKEESLTQKYVAEFLGNGKYEPHAKTRIAQRKNEKTAREEAEEKLRRNINFGSGFYSIAQAAEITRRSKHCIRKLIRDGVLTKLSFPLVSGDFVSGIELTDLVVKYNLDKIFGG